MPERYSISLLIRMPNWLGDCVMALPAVRHLSEALPQARILLAGRSGFAGLLAAQPGVAGFVETPDSGFTRLLRSMSGTRQILRDSGLPDGADVGLLFTNSLSTAAWLWRAGARRRIGYDLDCRRFFLTHPVPCGGVEQSWHFIRYYLWLAKFTESVISETEDIASRQTEPMTRYLVPALTVPKAARERIREKLAAHGITGRFAVLAPASAYGPVKDWPAGHYRRLAESLAAEMGLPAVITGGAGQAEICAGIAAGIPGAVSLAGGTTLEEFAALTAESALFVGGDSGGAHTAAALDVPTVVIFGITNPSRTCPTGRRVKSIGAGEERDVKLSTPAAREAARKALEDIPPEAVLAAAREACAM